MATVLAWIFTLLFIAAMVGIIIGQVQRVPQRASGKANCSYCGARLAVSSADRGKFATTCRKCGRDQPWKVA